ncbi:MAG TPA: hypothetical protein VFH80_01605, partial [Solirubrobacteraceae bacterium]|nr:hypothetical protein [Solirubrobacteraceae bacterium]
GPAAERRAHFWVVLPLVSLIAGGLVVLVLAVTPPGSRQGAMEALGLVALPVLMLVPAALYRGPGPSSDSGEDGGEGRGPDAPLPPPPPPPPRGDIPLPDAEPANLRLRDHDAARLVRRGSRRRSRAPTRR